MKNSKYLIYFNFKTPRTVAKGIVNDSINRQIAFVLFALFLPLFNSQLVPTDCSDFGPSLSNVTRCDGTVCYYTEVLHDSIDLVENDQRCYKFISPDNTISPVYLRISINNAYVYYDSDYSYITGDTAVDSKGFCGCPGGTSVSCTNCPVSFDSGEFNTCIDGNHQDSDCILNHLPGAHGTYCLKRNYRASRNVHVNHYINQMNLKATVIVDFNGSIWYGDFEGFSRTIVHQSGLEISLTGFSAIPVIVPEFSVWRNEPINNNDFKPELFLLDSTFVNPITECNTNKLGWYKPIFDPPICDSFQDPSYNKITIPSCDNNVFLPQGTFVNAPDFLSNLTRYERKVIDDRIKIVDQTYVDELYLNETSPINKQTISSGITAIINNTIITYGFTNTHLPIPSPEFVSTALVNAYDIKTGLPTDFTNFYISVNKLTDINNKHYYLLSLTLMDLSKRGICLIEEDDGVTNCYNSCNDRDTLDFPCLICYINKLNPNNTGEWAEQVCYKNDVELLLWPEFRVYNVSFIDFSVTSNHKTYETSYITDTTLWIPISEGTLDFTIILQNLTVTYSNLVTKPFIADISITDNRTIIITAKTLTNPGRCYLTSPDLFLIPKPIDLINVLTDYVVEIEETVAVGVFNVTLVCGPFMVSKSINLNINDTFVPVEESNTTVSWGSVLNPFNWTSLDEYGIGHIFAKIGIILGIIVAAIILFIILLPVLIYLAYIVKPLVFTYRYLKSKIFRRKTDDSGSKLKDDSSRSHSNYKNDPISRLIQRRHARNMERASQIY